jgi:lysophospholipid acyltransferase (LPLAT)-like uncharacterized protein
VKIRHRGLIRLVALLMAWLIRAWLSTLNYKVVFPTGIYRLPDPRHQRYICALWHESLLSALIVRTNIQALISQHADGELIAQVAAFLGYGAVRGSTTRGGNNALAELVDLSRPTHILVTPDGPRGPRRRFQAGTIYLASRTGLPLVLIGVGFSLAWRARSWDRFAVPLPWSTVYNLVSEPISVPPDLSKARRNELRDQVELLFTRLTAAAEGWAAGEPRPRCLSPATRTLVRKLAA